MCFQIVQHIYVSLSTYRKRYHECKSDILTRREFYLLFFTRMSFVMSVFTLTTFYKAFALTFIDDDHFITTYVGTFTGALQVGGKCSISLTSFTVIVINLELLKAVLRELLSCSVPEMLDPELHLLLGVLSLLAAERLELIGHLYQFGFFSFIHLLIGDLFVMEEASYILCLG